MYDSKDCEIIRVEIVDSHNENSSQSLEDFLRDIKEEVSEDDIDDPQKVLFQELTVDFQYACRFCNFKAPDIEALKNHSKSVHSRNQRPYKCRICDHKFTRKFTLKAHLRKVHSLNMQASNIEDFVVPTSYDSSDEDEASARLADTIYNCRFCDLKTTNAKRLRQHAMMVHNVDERPFKCEICSKRFTRQFNLIFHVKKMHGNKEEERVLCQICGKYYYSKVNLEMHMKHHLNIKPFQCHLCPKSFVSEPILKRHIIGHTGDKPYKCDRCDMSFFGRTKFEIHKMKHTGGKAYMCNVCKKIFIEKKRLEMHKITYHGVRTSKLS